MVLKTIDYVDDLNDSLMKVFLPFFQVEDSWTSLIGGLLAASRALSARARHDESEPRIFKESEDDEDDQDIDEDGGSEGTESSSHSSHKNQTFDRHLVLVGCQTFQVMISIALARQHLYF